MSRRSASGIAVQFLQLARNGDRRERSGSSPRANTKSVLRRRNARLLDAITAAAAQSAEDSFDLKRVLSGRRLRDRALARSPAPAEVGAAS